MSRKNHFNFALAVLLTLCLMLMTSSVIAQEIDGSYDHLGMATDEFVPGQVLVKTDGTSINNINTDLGLVPDDVADDTTNESGVNVVTFVVQADADAALEAYNGHANVEYAEPNYLYTALYVPNDYLYPQQWNFHPSDGITTFGGVDMEAAWEIPGPAPSYGAPAVIVAIVDTGVAYEDYTDGTGSYFIGPDLFYTNFAAGYDFVNSDDHPNDDNGHGTHVAGIISQNTDVPAGPPLAGWGTAGGAPSVSIMPMKALDATGVGTALTVADSIIWAVDNGATVINLSAGSSMPSLTVEAAVIHAHDTMGATLIAASGNNATSPPAILADEVVYPAAYDEVIAVGATDAMEQKTYYSHFGPELDLVAPGGDNGADLQPEGYPGHGLPDGILQETINQPPADLSNFGFWFYQGTSMAAAHVSAVAALIQSMGVITDPEEIRSILHYTARDLLTPGWDAETGWGLLNAGAALASANGPAPTAEANGPYTADEGTAIVFDSSGSVDLSIAAIVSYEWDFGDPNDTTPGTGPSPSHTYAQDGAYVVTLTVIEDGGRTSTDTANVTINNVVPVVSGPVVTLTPPHPSGNFLVGDLLDLYAEFTDPGVLDTHTATIDWDEGAGPQAADSLIEPTSPGEVHGSYAYSAPGTYTVEVVVYDDDGMGSNSVTIDVIVPVPPVASNNGPYEDDEGDPVTLDGSGSTDADGIIALYRWTIYCDDNNDPPSPDPRVPEYVFETTEPIYTFVPEDNHEPEVGVPCDVVLTVIDDDDQEDSDITFLLIHNVDPVVSCCGVTPTEGDEGTELTFEACLTDQGSADTHTGEWDFGDGSAPVSGDVPDILTVTHTFADDDGDTTYDVTFTAEDDDQGIGTTTCPVTIHNVAPTVVVDFDSVVPAGVDGAANEGDTVNILVTFTDPGADEFVLEIDWDGDSVVDETIDPAVSPELVPHVYPDGGVPPTEFTVTATVTDDEGDSGSDSMVMTISNVNPTVDAGPSVTIVEGESVTVTASVTDPAGAADSPYVATIDWGEGAGPEAPDSFTEPTSPGEVVGTHTYLDNGVFTVTVEVVDKDGGVGSDTLEVTVTNALPIVDAGADQVVDEGDLVTVTATFTDEGDLDAEFTGTISWGDSDQPEDVAVTITGVSSEFGVSTVSGEVTATHVYADDSPTVDDYEVIVTITDKDGGVGADSIIVTVNNVPPDIDPDNPGDPDDDVIVLDAGADGIIDEGETVTFSIGFSDPGTGDDHTIAWDMGDGTLIPAEITSGALSVTHSYDDNGDYTVSVTVADDDGGSDTATLDITVMNVAPTVDAGDDVEVAEGEVLVFNGSFTDPSPVDTHVAWVNWGDGQEGWATVDPATRTTQANHVYADGPNTYTVTLTVTDDDDGVGSDQMIVTVVNEVPCVEAGPDQEVDEGDVVQFTGSFDDPAGVNDEDYTIVWDFDDGSSDSSGTLTPTHIFTDNDVYTVTLTVTDKDGGVGIDQLEVTVNNVAPVVTPGDDQTENEGDVVTVDATFTDPSIVDTHTATINWDDGTGDEAVPVVQNPGSGSLSGTHVYADNRVYTVTVTVTDDDGGVGMTYITVTINNVAPVADAGDNWSDVYEGEDIVVDLEPFGLTDAGTLDTHTATIDWGDDTPIEAGVVNETPYGPPGSTAGMTGEIRGTHTYNADDGEYVVTLTVTDDDGASDSDSMVVVVQNVAPTVIPGLPQTISEGDTALFDGVFTDPAGDADAPFDVCWTFGDVYSVGEVSCDFQESLGAVTDHSTPTHLYPENGVFPVTMSVTDKDGGIGVEATQVTVLNVAPVVDPVPNQTVDEGDTVNFSATFSDVGVLDTHTAMINWGDETAFDVIDPATSPVGGSHVYPDGPGVYTVLVSVEDDDGDVGTTTFTVTVNNVPPVVEAGDDQEVDEGDTVDIAPTFTDVGVLDTHSATIDWGDGVTDTVPVATSPIAGSHVYADNDVYTVTVTVTDKDGDSGVDTLTVTVNNVAPTVTALSDQTVNEGLQDIAVFDGSFTDPGAADTHTIEWDFGDGSTAAGSLAATHSYGDNGVYTATLTVTDDDGGVGTDTVEVTVINLPPVVDAGADQIADAGITVDEAATYTDPGWLDTHTATIDWGDGSAVDDGVVTEPGEGPGTVTGSHAYAASGIYTATVEVSDDDCVVTTANGENGNGNGETPVVECKGSDTFIVTVSANVPVAVGAGAPTPVAPEALVTFDHSASYHDSYFHNIVTYEWDFQSDGTVDYTTTYATDTPTYAYPFIAGVLCRVETATLTVTDDNDPAKTDTDTVNIEVVFPNKSPVANANGPYVTELGDGITFDGSASFDPDSATTTDTIVSYVWDLNNDGIFGEAVGAVVSKSGAQLAAVGLNTAGVHPIALRVTDTFGATGTAYSTLTLEAPQLVAMRYDVLNTILELEFDKLVMADLTCLNYIGMEIGDSGIMDAALSKEIGLEIQEWGATYTITMDINHSIATVKNLAIAHFGQHKRIDAVLMAGAVTNRYGGANVELTGDANVRVQICPTTGDVTGNGKVSAFDAATILQATVGDESAYPIADAADGVSAMLASVGYDVDVMTSIADLSGNGVVSSYDAALALRAAVGLPPMAPPISSTTKVARLNVSDCDSSKLEVSIDLDSVKDVYSADIVITYDPSALKLADVSKTSALTDWLSADGGESGKLKISLAGSSEPVSNGSMVSLSFEGDGMSDAISKLDITKFELNGGTLKARVENLPKSFALLQNYPNPFNPETWIPYQLSKPADVSVIIYNVNGQMVRRLELGSMMPGHYTDRSRSAYWDGRNDSGEMVSSGIYFYQLQAGRDAEVKKMIIVK